MPPREYFEFVVLRMTYDAFIDPYYPRISLTRKQQNPSASIVEIKEWFDRAMTRERSKLPLGAKHRYTEWRIISGNAKLFYIDGFRFDNIIVFMGEESNYWMFYENVECPRRFVGSGRIPLTYCGCCLSNQYITVLDTIKMSSEKAVK